MEIYFLVMIFVAYEFIRNVMWRLFDWLSAGVRKGVVEETRREMLQMLRDQERREFERARYYQGDYYQAPPRAHPQYHPPHDQSPRAYPQYQPPQYQPPPPLEQEQPYTGDDLRMWATVGRHWVNQQMDGQRRRHSM